MHHRQDGQHDGRQKQAENRNFPTSRLPFTTLAAFFLPESLAAGGGDMLHRDIRVSPARNVLPGALDEPEVD